MSERNLTDADVQAIVEQFHEVHTCRFKEVAPEDLIFMKDLLGIYKETRSEIIKWIVRGIVYGSLILIGVASYFKLKGIK